MIWQVISRVSSLKWDYKDMASGASMATDTSINCFARCQRFVWYYHLVSPPRIVTEDHQTLFEVSSAHPVLQVWLKLLQEGSKYEVLTRISWKHGHLGQVAKFIPEDYSEVGDDTVCSNLRGCRLNSGKNHVDILMILRLLFCHWSLE